MKKLIMISAASIIAVMFAACNNSSLEKTSTTDTTAMKPAMDTMQTKSAMDTSKKTMMATTKYTCTMHPEVISDKPGKCPKCGMDLVEMKTSVKKDSMSVKHDSKMKMN